MGNTLSEGPCQKDPVRRTLSEGHCQKDTVRRTLSEGHCQKDTVRRTLSEGHCQKDTVRRTLSEGHCQKDTVRRTLSEGHCQKDTVRRTFFLSPKIISMSREYNYILKHYQSSLNVRTLNKNVYDIQTSVKQVLLQGVLTKNGSKLVKTEDLKNVFSGQGT